MPRAVTIYNGDSDEIGTSSVVGDKIEGQTDNRDSHSPLHKVTEDSMTERDEENRLAMAVEFDHMYIGCSETKASIGKDIEVQHLKDLLLLHLDLIQQQAEQLVAKDKLIKRLRDENENLKAKLDRIDRRVSLSLGKKASESTCVEPKTEPDSEELQLDTQPTKRFGSPTGKTDSQATKTQSPSNKTAASGKSPSSKPLSPASKSLSPASKPGSPPSKPGSPASKPGSPASKPGSPASKPGSPASKPGSPSSKPGSPASKPGSPASKPGSPVSKPGSPASKPRSPPSKSGSSASKAGSPASKPGCPASKPVSPVNRSSSSANKVVSPTIKVSPPNKLGSPSSKSASSNKTAVPSSKPLPPEPKVSSPPSKAVSPSSKNGILSSKPSSPSCIKPSSPQPKTATVQNTEELQTEQVETCSVESTSNKILSTSKAGKRPAPKSGTPKASTREKRQRSTSQSQISETESEAASAKDLPKSNIIEKERSRTKRKSESESDTSPPKRIRTDRDSKSSHTKDDGLTDHNLRSRDKSRDRPRTKSQQDEPPESPVEFAATPSPRAAALEAKKLRQKLQLKEQTMQGQTCGHKRGKTPIGASVRAEGILNTTVSYHLPYGVLIHDPNPEEECLQAQVEIPRWGTRVLTSLYVMEGTENLEDEIFIKRHAKPEQDEKRRKRWDLQRMREQRHYERLRERYESRQSSNEPEVSGHGSLWPHPESAMYLHVEDTLPVCAFGQPLARIPPQEFAIPWLTGHCSEGVSTRRRKR